MKTRGPTPMRGRSVPPDRDYLKSKRGELRCAFSFCLRRSGTQNTAVEESMNIHEYQGKAVLKSFGAPVLEGRPALSVEEAVAAAKALPGPVYVVKSQIHAGGRGKGKFRELPAGGKGGVRRAQSLDEAAAFAREMLGNTLVTAQTG